MLGDVRSILEILEFQVSKKRSSQSSKALEPQADCWPDEEHMISMRLVPSLHMEKYVRNQSISVRPESAALRECRSQRRASFLRRAKTWLAFIIKTNTPLSTANRIYDDIKRNAFAIGPAGGHTEPALPSAFAKCAG